VAVDQEDGALVGAAASSGVRRTVAVNASNHALASARECIIVKRLSRPPATTVASIWFAAFLDLADVSVDADVRLLGPRDAAEARREVLVDPCIDRDPIRDRGRGGLSSARPTSRRIRCATTNSR
jgi:hypothetical protein